MKNMPRAKFRAAALALLLVWAMAACAPLGQVANYQADFTSDLITLHKETMTSLLKLEAAFRGTDKSAAAYANFRAFYEETAPLYMSRLELRAVAGAKKKSLDRLKKLQGFLQELKSEHENNSLDEDSVRTHRKNLQISFIDMLKVEFTEKDAGD
jgi:hypothetical protein